MFNSAFAGTLPIAATDAAVRWDHLFQFLVYLSVFFFVLVVGAMIVFAIKYRRRQGIKTKYVTGSHSLEAVFVAIPTVLLMGIFAWGWSVYRSMTAVPSDAYEIHVIAKQWLWQFQYDDGRTTLNEVYVPMNRPVKLVMTSQDVIHSFFVPNFRLKQDVVPGMYTSVWFEARVPGAHQVFCAEYCGTGHSGMLAKVIALPDAQWKAWLRGKKPGAVPAVGLGGEPASGAAGGTVSLAAQGKKIFETKGCTACHTIDGTPKVGPTLKGVAGSNVVLNDGKTVVADENYLRESIETPQAKIVKGFQPVMPTFKGLLSETELNALIAYIKSLK